MKKNTWISGSGALLLALLAVCFLSAATKITSYDFWWHVKTGELIFDTRSIPATDQFSFTARGHPRIAHDWLAEIIFYLFMQLGNFPTVVLLKAAVVAAAFFFVILFLQKEGISFNIIGICIILSLFGARFRFTERPEIFSLFFTALFLFLLFDSRRTARIRELSCVVPVTVLWVNLHGGGILAPIYVLIFLVGELVNRTASSIFWTMEREEQERKIPLKYLLLVLVLALLATLVNPNGIEIWKATSEANFVRSSGFAVNPEWLRPEAADFPLFYLSLALFLIVTTLSFRRLDFSQLLITLFLACIACIYLRMIGLFFIGFPFFLATHVPRMGITQRGREFFRKLIEGRFLLFCFLALMVLSTLFFLFSRGLQEFGFGVKPERFPVAASDFLERHYRGDFLYNDVRFGGYLIWRFYPERRVFIDGRNELYGPLLARIAGGLNNHKEWLKLLDDYRIDSAIVSYWPELKGVVYQPSEAGAPPMKGYRAYSAFLFQKKDWALVYWDDCAMIFLKRDAGNAVTVQEYEYRYLNPEDWQYLYSLSRADSALKEKIMAECLRRMKEEPPSEKAALIYEKFKE